MERMYWFPILVFFNGPIKSIAILSLGSNGVSVICGSSFPLIRVVFDV